MLKPLLKAWNVASDSGAHGNFEAIMPSYAQYKEQKVLFTHPTTKHGLALQVSMHNLDTGYRLLQAFTEILADWIENRGDWDNTMKDVSALLEEARKVAEVAHRNYMADMDGK